jgi:hypothetical protein
MRWVEPSIQVRRISSARSSQPSWGCNPLSRGWAAKPPAARRERMIVGVCVLYAFFDEGHQMLVPGRTPSLYDVALDSTGALFSRFLNLTIAELA